MNAAVKGRLERLERAVGTRVGPRVLWEDPDEPGTYWDEHDYIRYYGGARYERGRDGAVRDEHGAEVVADPLILVAYVEQCPPWRRS